MAALPTLDAAFRSFFHASSMTGRPSWNRWGALGILMVLAFLNYMDRNLVYPLLSVIGRDLGIPIDRLGALATGFHVVYACSAPLVGAISDRVARKTLLLVSLVGWSLITALSGTAQGFLSLLVWRSLTGLGEGGYFPTAVSVIGDLFRPHERGLAIALHGMCTTLGGSAGYVVGGLLGQRLGWRVPFFLAVVPGLVLAVVLARSLEEPVRGAIDRAAGEPPSRRPYGRIVSSAPVLLMALAACFGAFSTTGLNTFLPLYLSNARGVSVERAGVLTGLFFAATLIGQLSGGVTSDRLVTRIGGARPLLVGLAYLLAAPAALAVAHLAPVALALVCYGATQLLRGFAEPSIYGSIIDATSAHERGSAQGFLLMLTFVGSSASGWGGGALIRHFGYTTALHGLAAASLLAGALATGLAARAPGKIRLQ